MRVVFVCTGNTCRSPMAAAYLASKNIPSLSVSSAGLFADGSAVSDNAARAMEKIGIDISSHISRRITADDLSADMIICLSPSHAAQLAAAGVDKKKLSVLGNGIQDPFGGDINVYEHCRDEITAAIDALCRDGVFRLFRIVPFEPRHLAAVSKLEQVCFSEPWSSEGIIESYRCGTVFFVAENDSDVMGYIGINTAADEGYITNVAVFPAYRRQGIATALLKRTFGLARERKLAFVSLEVRRSNLEAIELYEGMGFKKEGERRDFYRAPVENALIFTKRFKTDEDTGN